MTNKKSIPAIAGEIYNLLEPLESTERNRVVASALTMLGEETQIEKPKSSNSINQSLNHDQDNSENNSALGIKAKRWIKQNSVQMESIEEVFHIDGGDVEVITGDVPGNGKRVKTINCYLLVGIQSLLAVDEPKFSEEKAVELCRNMGCHDSANHSKTRSDFGNTVAGSKSSGYTLPAPGLKAAAQLIKEMASTA